MLSANKLVLPKQAPNFGPNLGNNRKRKFFGNTIKAMRGDDWVSAHFNKRTMTVHFVMNCPITKQWSSVEVEQEIFERLNRAKFDIQPSEHWGFLDRKLREDIRQVSIPFGNWDGKTTRLINADQRDILQPASTVFHFQCEVRVRQMNTNKVENAPYLKKEEPRSYPKNERFD